ncbi:hypothetical protein WBP07_12520 [Novosphingobium sp. BL-8A]|uniref:hypothetical protein n=1 Tax=Novosphingobium sp. BL-8A TaxID=3127639 RepID=UPI0037583ED1
MTIAQTALQSRDRFTVPRASAGAARISSFYPDGNAERFSIVTEQLTRAGNS